MAAEGTAPRSRHASVRQAARQGRNLNEAEAYELLASYGIQVPRFGLAREPDEAARLAESLGGPVVLKIASPDILHKSDLGGVRVGVASAAGARLAYEEIVAAVRAGCPDARLDGVIVAEQIGMGKPGAVEAIIGVTRDPQFGHAVMFGLGGIFVEVLRDVTFRVLPVTPAEAAEMLDEVKGAPLLRGYRGRRPCDRGALAGTIAALSGLVEENPEIDSIDLNPVFVLERGAWAVDAKVTL